MHPFASMSLKEIPPVACVTVSTAESPVYNRDLDCPPYVADSLSEKACLRYLVKECGWYWIHAGVLRKHWNSEAS